MESEIEEECVEVAAFISKTNSEFLRAAAASDNCLAAGPLQVALVTSRLFWGQILVRGKRWWQSHSQEMWSWCWESSVCPSARRYLGCRDALHPRVILGNSP